EPNWGRDSVALDEAWRGHTNRWRYELPSVRGVLWEQFRRGFVEVARVSSPEHFVEFGPRMMALAPIAEVNFGTCENLAQLADSDGLQRVRRLRFRQGRSPTATDQRLVS